MKRKILYLKSFPKQFENIGGMIKLEALFDKNNITVFCSASNDIDQKYVDGAKKVAQIISEKKYNLVYGGDSIGLMGNISKAMKENGRQVCGVCIKDMYSKGLFANYCDKIIVVDSLEERKKRMISGADTIVCMPGGIGTLNELLDVLVMSHLKLISHKKIILVNIDNFFSYFLDLLMDLKKNKFLKEDLDDMFTIIDQVDDLGKIV